jgi:hypothetical protein
VHMREESNEHRRTVLGKVSSLDVEAFIARASLVGRSHRDARDACLRELVSWLVMSGVTQVVFESCDEDEHDGAVITAALKALPARRGPVSGTARRSSRHRAAPQLAVAHRRPAADALLWLPDIVVWAHGRGGKWAARTGPLVTLVRDCPQAAHQPGSDGRPAGVLDPATADRVHRPRRSAPAPATSPVEVVQGASPRAADAVALRAEVLSPVVGREPPRRRVTITMPDVELPAPRRSQRSHPEPGQQRRARPAPDKGAPEKTAPGRRVPGTTPPAAPALSGTRPSRTRLSSTAPGTVRPTVTETPKGPRGRRRRPYRIHSTVVPVVG